MGSVLTCVDFSELSERVVDQGGRLATAMEEPMHLLHVAAGEPELAGYDKDEISPHTRDARASELHQERSMLETLAARVSGRGFDVVPHLTMGHTVQQILARATHVDAELIVIGSHGHGALRHLLVGSVAEALLRASPFPVVVVPMRAVT